MLSGKCGSAGIGRQAGLRCLCPTIDVWVQVPSPAPEKAVVSFGGCFFYSRMGLEPKVASHMIARYAGREFLARPAQVPSPAPRQNKAIRSCSGTSAATLTGNLVFPFPSQTHSVVLRDGIGSNLDYPGAPEKAVVSFGGCFFYSPIAIPH